MPKFAKGHSSETNDGICSKVDHVVFYSLSSIPYQLTKFQAPSSNKVQGSCWLTSLKCPISQRAITMEPFDVNCSKVNQAIYSSSHIS